MHIYHCSLKFKMAVYVFTLMPIFLNAQTIKIIDFDTKNPIPYATIELYEMQIKTFCDQKGEFSFNINTTNTPIIISADGYESESFSFKNSDLRERIISLKPAHIVLNEVIVSPTTGLLQQHNLSNVFLKKISSTDNLFASNIMGTVSNVPGVNTIYTGAGINKPVIRGMSGLKVVTFLNGLRIENQQWANDHGINFLDLGIKHVEIIKGPSSLLYGADALGGVLYFMDEDYASPHTSEQFFETSFETNSLATISRVAMKKSYNNIRFNIYLGHTSSADYMIPNGNYVLNSRFNGKSLKTALGFNTDKWILNIRYTHNSNQVGLPGHTHSSSPNPSDFLSMNQNRYKVIPFQLISDHYISVENKIVLENSVLKFVTGFTSNSLTEHEEKVTIPGIKMLLTNVPYHLSFTRQINENVNWISGFQGMFVKNTNDLSALNVLIPNSRSEELGAYSLFRYTKRLFETQVGLRYDYRVIEAEQINSQSYAKFNSSLGFLYLNKPYTLRFNFSSGFRPPHISEMLADGVHHGTNRYEKGALDLESEFAHQFDLSLDLNTEHVDLNINPFYNVYNNYIYIDPSGEEIDGYPVYYYTQTSSAKTYGGEFFLHYHPHFAHRLHVEQGFSVVKGEDKDQNPIPLIPQTRINTNLMYEFVDQNRKIQIKTIAVNRTQYLSQNQISSFETTSKGYELYDVEANLSVEQKNTLFLKLGIRNLFNTTYINHLSNLKAIGLPGAGRNFYISMSYNIN